VAKAAADGAAAAMVPTAAGAVAVTTAVGAAAVGAVAMAADVGGADAGGITAWAVAGGGIPTARPGCGSAANAGYLRAKLLREAA
jgi:hypothetical protein